MTTSHRELQETGEERTSISAQVLMYFKLNKGNSSDRHLFLSKLQTRHALRFYLNEPNGREFQSITECVNYEWTFSARTVLRISRITNIRSDIRNHNLTCCVVWV
jgi:hypothetical protein